MYNLLIMQQQLKRNDNLSLHTRTYFYHINSSFLYFHGSNLFFYAMAERKVSIHLTCKFRCRFCRYFPLPTDKKSRKKKANYGAISRYFSPWRIN